MITMNLWGQIYVRIFRYLSICGRRKEQELLGFSPLCCILEYIIASYQKIMFDKIDVAISNKFLHLSAFEI